MLVLAAAAAAAQEKPRRASRRRRRRPAPPAPAYIYNAEGRRDPFVSLLRRATDPRRQGKQPPKASPGSS